MNFFKFFIIEKELYFNGLAEHIQPRNMIYVEHRNDVVRDYIFNFIIKSIKTRKILKSTFMTGAIKQDRFEFVNLILQNRFSLSTYLTYKQLFDLYRDVRSIEHF